MKIQECHARQFPEQPSMTGSVPLLERQLSMETFARCFAEHLLGGSEKPLGRAGERAHLSAQDESEHC